jgi:hypothetical protein
LNPVVNTVRLILPINVTLTVAVNVVLNLVVKKVLKVKPINV